MGYMTRAIRILPHLQGRDPVTILFSHFMPS